MTVIHFCLFDSPLGSTQTGGKIQTNAFMRPLSSGGTEQTGTKAPTTSSNSVNNTVTINSQPNGLQDSQVITHPVRAVVQGPVVTTKAAAPASTSISSAYEKHSHIVNNNPHQQHSNAGIAHTTTEHKTSSSNLKPKVSRPPSGRKAMGISTVNPSSLGIKAAGIHSAPQSRPGSASNSNRHRTIVRNASSGTLVTQGNQTGSEGGNRGNNASRSVLGSGSSSVPGKHMAESQSSGYISGTATVLNSKHCPTAAPRQAFTTQSTVVKNSTNTAAAENHSAGSKTEKKGATVIVNKFQPRDKRPSSGTVRGGSASHVRNPNYTPAKPYSEVSTDSDNTSRNSSAGSVRSVYQNMEVGPNRNPQKTDKNETNDKKQGEVGNKGLEKGGKIATNKETNGKRDSGSSRNEDTRKPTLRKNVSFSSPHAMEINPEMLLDGRVKEMPVTHTMTGNLLKFCLFFFAPFFIYSVN